MAHSDHPCIELSPLELNIADRAHGVRLYSGKARLLDLGERVFARASIMANFDLFLPMLLKFEGGYVDDPEDPGGETNKGITMRAFQQCSHELLGLDPSSENLKGLTDAQAGIIYKARYWSKMQGDFIELQDLANITCDFFVNAGTHATKLLQHELNVMGAHVVEDGVIGAACLQALSGMVSVEVYRRYKVGRQEYYYTLGKRFPKFLPGWLKRVNSFPDL